PVADGVQTVETDLPYYDQGNVELDVKAQISDSLLSQLRANGAQVINLVAAENSVRISIAIDSVEAIANLPEVIFVQPRQDSMTSQAIRVEDDTKQSKVGRK